MPPFEPIRPGCTPRELRLCRPAIIGLSPEFLREFRHATRQNSTQPATLGGLRSHDSSAYNSPLANDIFQNND
jgi:hypothetical protein